MPQTMPSPHRGAAQAVCRAAAASFAVGLLSLRVCWLPGVNVLLAAAAVALGVFACWQILHSHGAMQGMDEAVSGLVLGIVVIGLSTFFITALIAAWRR
ncbi:MAG: hypothetical protein QN141_00585 [Armatimonadota bacterium]|nr:hypothetical protein [Armatimonadota bacterium]MDR7450834.1 hypothetical protein [Armatimonadota bacterium]MDR7465755.1 hypothetical protein [Armatimonadota bacterium]MDR7493663.1 hypothetical protein [Armatimonadota bacterium]MDR7499088.1 hypothetical protein [Armatimonadota bacterium]